jgi:hypothetical protein
MESTGAINKIHLSKETAELLIAAGKAHWVMLREDVVEAKGKGRLQTFWLKSKGGSGANRNSDTVGSEEEISETSSSICDEEDLGNNLDTIEGEKVNQPVASAEKKRRSGRASNVAFGESDIRQRSDRLVDWNVEVLFNLLKKIAVRRRLVKIKPTLAENNSVHGNTSPLQEVKEVMQMPAYNAEAAVKAMTSDSVELPPEVRSQLRDFVQTISSFYLDNPFHNFGKISMTRKSGSKLMVNVISCLLSVIPF